MGYSSNGRRERSVHLWKSLIYRYNPKTGGSIDELLNTSNGKRLDIVGYQLQSTAVYRPFKISSFPTTLPAPRRVLDLENSPLKSSLSSSRSTCRLTSPSPSSALTRFCRMNVWNPDAFAVLMFIKIDLEASPVAVNGCWEADSESCS